MPGRTRTCTLLSIIDQSTYLNAFISIDNAYGTSSHNVSQTAATLGPISDTLTKTVTDSRTGAIASYDNSVNTTISSPSASSDAGSASLSDSIKATPSTNLYIDVHSQYVIHVNMYFPGTLSLKFDTSGLVSFPDGGVGARLDVLRGSTYVYSSNKSDTSDLQVPGGEYEIILTLSANHTTPLFRPDPGA